MPWWKYIDDEVDQIGFCSTIPMQRLEVALALQNTSLVCSLKLETLYRVMGILERQWVSWKSELFETFNWNWVRIDSSSRLQCCLAIHCLGSQWSLPALQPFVPLSRNILWSAWLWRLSRTYSKPNRISLPFDHMFWSKDRLITHVVPAKPFPETFKLGSGTFFSEPGDAKDPAHYQKKKAELQVSLQEAERISRCMKIPISRSN